MTDFSDRERAEEAKFALDGETAFRIADVFQVPLDKVFQWKGDQSAPSVE